MPSHGVVPAFNSLRGAVGYFEHGSFETEHQQEDGGDEEQQSLLQAHQQSTNAAGSQKQPTDTSSVLTPTANGSRHMHGFELAPEAVSSQAQAGHAQQAIDPSQGSHTCSGMHKHCRFDSLDYELIENTVYRTDAAGRTHLDHLLEAALKWTICLALGIITAGAAFAVNFGVENIAGFKFWATLTLLNRGNAVLSYLVYVLINCSLIVASVALTVLVAPSAAGSGIAEVKAYLNGIDVPSIFFLRTLVVKLSGSVGAVAGGLAVGKEGPFVHADQLMQGLCASLQPVSRSLFKVYAVVMLFYMFTVLVKLKSLGLSLLLERERSQQYEMIAASGGRAQKTGSTEDLERMLVPFDAASSWLMYMLSVVAAAQLVGVDIAPLIAVGGAGSIVLGLATQQLLTNAFMGLSLFFSRPFVDGDSVTVQGAGAVVSGVVERTTVMRTVLRTDDDVIVTIPNKVVVDMVVYNRSAEVRRSMLASANRQTENIKLRLKLPYTAEDKLQEVQDLVKDLLEPPLGSSASVSAASSISEESDGSISGSEVRGAAVTSSSQSVESIKAQASQGKLARAPAHPVVRDSVNVAVSKLTETGFELFVKAKLRVEPSHSSVQVLLLDLSKRVRQLGGMLVNM